VFWPPFVFFLLILGVVELFLFPLLQLPHILTPTPLPPPVASHFFWLSRRQRVPPSPTFPPCLRWPPDRPSVKKVSVGVLPGFPLRAQSDLSPFALYVFELFVGGDSPFSRGTTPLPVFLSPPFPGWMINPPPSIRADSELQIPPDGGLQNQFFLFPFPAKTPLSFLAVPPP